MDEAFQSWLGVISSDQFMETSMEDLREIFAAGYEAGYDEGKMDGSLSELEHQQASENY